MKIEPISLSLLLLSQAVSGASIDALIPPLRGSADATVNLDDDVPDTFEPAITLEEFAALDNATVKEGSYFEWIDSDEIEAGGTTCGFLHAPLRWPHSEVDDSFPEVKVYTCVKFAEIQPAPRGNLAVHCGGPGSLSDCVYSMGGEDTLGEIAASTYNVIAFDQRGMGRSQPSFYTEECANTDEMNYAFNALDASDEESIREVARASKERNLKCWNYEGFRLEKEQGDGDVKAFHFLEYSGTRQLAEDIERVRLLFGDQKLSVYGISYGTTVMGTYVTVFPHNVNLMVLDGNTSPVADVEESTIQAARAANNRIEFFLASCEFSNTNVCGVEDARGCVKGLHTMLDGHARDVQQTFGYPVPVVFTYAIKIFFEDYNNISKVCRVVQSQSYSLLKAILVEKTTSPDEPSMALIAQTGGDKDGDGFVMPCLEYNGNEYGCESKPSTDDEDDFFFPGYKAELADAINLVAVRTQDYLFGVYSEDEFVDRVVEINRKYPGAGTQVPAKRIVMEFRQAYFTPNTTPLTPMGNPSQTGIVSGQLYDPATTYYWTQLMRQNFPLSSLLTSRSVNHGMDAAQVNGSNDPACQAYIQRYFKYGAVDFVDGHVCESDSITDSCSIATVLSNGRCGSTSSSVVSTD